jgi:hypothetical protein
MKRNHYQVAGPLAVLALAAIMLAASACTTRKVTVTVEAPPVIAFPAPPELVVIPGTDVYVCPDLDADLFFYDGWWWRNWNGRWYRSPYYDRGWQYYSSAPSFYRTVPGDWRNNYRGRQWEGHPWNYQRVPYDRVQQNWKTWKNDRYWQNNHNWGVEGPPPPKQHPWPGALQPKPAPKPVKPPPINHGHGQPGHPPANPPPVNHGHEQPGHPPANPPPVNHGHEQPGHPPEAHQPPGQGQQPPGKKEPPAKAKQPKNNKAKEKAKEKEKEKGNKDQGK